MHFLKLNSVSAEHTIMPQTQTLLVYKMDTSPVHCSPCNFIKIVQVPMLNILIFNEDKISFLLSTFLCFVFFSFGFSL